MTKGSRVLEKKVNGAQVSNTVFSHLNNYINSGKKLEVVRERGLGALKDNMASVSVENVEKKRKKYGHKCCGAAKCEKEMFYISKVLITKFGSQSISVQPILKLVLQATEDS